VPRFLRQRALLPPPRHPRIDQTGIGGLAGFRAKPEPLHDRRSEPFDQCVRLRQEFQYRGDRLRPLEIERYRALVAIVEVEPGWQFRLDAGLGDAIDADDVSAEIAEQRARKGRRSDAPHLDDTKALQRSGQDELPW